MSHLLILWIVGLFSSYHLFIYVFSPLLCNTTNVLNSDVDFLELNVLFYFHLPSFLFLFYIQCFNYCILTMCFIIQEISLSHYVSKICLSYSLYFWGILLNWLIDILYHWGPFQKHRIHFLYVSVSVKFSVFLNSSNYCKCDLYSYFII